MPVGQEQNFNYEIVDEMNHTVWLEACNAHCCAESYPVHLKAGICPSGLEGNHWIFGVDGIHLDWSTSTPVEQSPKNHNSLEMSTLAIDNNGKLLFYLNPWERKLVNRNHNFMLNMSTSGTQLNPSSTQAITLPQPGSDSLWYLFYPENFRSDPLQIDLDTTTKLYYAIVDMTGDGGLGEVIMADEVLLLPSTEKVAATRHCNGVDWWVIGHEAGSNRFFAWLLTEDGLANPIVSQEGIIRSKFKGTKAGELNFSPDGTQIAMVTGRDFITEFTSMIEVFSFDNSSGFVSNGNLIKQTNNTNTSYLSEFLYGIEFSPSGRYLYAPGIDKSGTWFQYVSQFDLWAGDLSAIQNSETEVFRSYDLGYDFCNLLTGPDMKIYGANFSDSSLCVIHRPDEKGVACQFEADGLLLQNGESFLGLPTFPAGIYTPEKPRLTGPRSICDTVSEVLYRVTGNCVYQDYDWNVEGNSTIIRRSGDSIWIHPVGYGSDRLIVTKYTACRTVSDTFSFEVVHCTDTVITTDTCNMEITWNAMDTVVCRGEDVWLRFNTNATTTSYEILADGILQPVTQSIIQISRPSVGDTVRLYFDGEHCDSIVDIPYRVTSALHLEINRMDSLICMGDSATIDFTTDGDSIEILNPSLTRVYSDPAFPLSVGPIFADSNYIVRVRNMSRSCDSVFIWSIEVDENINTTVDTFLICAGDSLFVHDSLWIKDTTVAPIYKRIDRVGCDSFYGIAVQFYPEMIHEFIIDTACFQGTGGITVTSTGGLGQKKFTWSTGENNSTISGQSAGQYWVIVENMYCRDSLNVELIEFNEITYAIDVVHQICPFEDDGSITFDSGYNLHLSLDGINFIDNMQLDSLPVGVHTIYIKDDHDCISIEEISIDSAGIPELDFTIEKPTCKGDNGLLKIEVQDGRIYTYAVDNDLFQSDSIFLLSAGEYLFSIKNEDDCVFQELIEVPEGLHLDYDIEVVDESCSASSDGQIIFNGNADLLISLNGGVFTGTRKFLNLDTGDYVLIVAGPDTVCTDTLRATIKPAVVLSIDFPDDTIIVNGTMYFIDPSAFIEGNPDLFHWLPSGDFACPMCNTGEVISGRSGWYYLEIERAGCTVVDSIFIQFTSNSIYIPNVFRPNSPFNPTFRIFSQDNDQIIKRMDIYDRWGSKIFSRFGSMEVCQWDGRIFGKAAPSGVYVYQIIVQGPDGQESNYVGNVLLIN